MTILVLGAAGMLGSAVARLGVYLGAQVHGVVRPGTGVERLAGAGRSVIVHRLELEDLSSLGRLMDHVAPRLIVHSAFPSIRAPAGPDSRRELLHALDVTLNVLEAVRSSGFSGHLVVLGSAMCYGPSDSIHRVSDPLLPSTFRGAVKAAESLLVRQFGLEAGCTATELRVCTVYGPWEQPDRLIPSLFAAALAGERVAITPESHLRDWIHVEDAARACIDAGRRATGAPALFNIGTGKLHGTHEVARMAEAITGCSLIGDEQFPGRDHYGDRHPLCELPDARDDLEWRPKVDLASGMRAYWAWARTEAGRRFLLGERAGATA